MTEDLNDDFMQFIMDQLNKSYSQYKRQHPDFAKVVEEQLEGKTDGEFERQSTKKKTHCKNCGEWLEGNTTCYECGELNN
jgi:hypothetical protein